MQGVRTVNFRLFYALLQTSKLFLRRNVYEKKVNERTVVC